jgi:hypothetical protein
MSMEADLDSRLFGLFPVNILHNLVHLAFGAWGILGLDPRQLLRLPKPCVGQVPGDRVRRMG